MPFWCRNLVDLMRVSRSSSSKSLKPLTRRIEISRAVTSLVAAIVLAACSKRMPTKPLVADPVEGAEVEVGSLVQSQAVISLDVLIPADGDIPTALEAARQSAKRDGVELVDALPSTASHAVMTIQLKSVADEGWNHHLPGFVVSKIDPDDFPAVDASAGVVRLDARAPATQAWELLRTVPLARAESQKKAAHMTSVLTAGRRLDRANG
jgi:hypothetical protein